jgi:Fe2+ or Zn2+ uptake regulation protein
MLDSKGVDAGLLQSKYRLTKQRAAVLRALEDGAHLTAETILERVRRHLPSVSLGTVYRTLDILRDIGLVQAFAHAGNAARYEAALDKHHHLLCTACNTITNVKIPNISALAREVAAMHRFSETDCSLTITGTCAQCAGTSGTRQVEPATASF